MPNSTNETREDLLGSLGPVQTWDLLFELCYSIARVEGVSSPEDVTQDVLASMLASHLTPGMLLAPTAYLRRCIRRWAARQTERERRAYRAAVALVGDEPTPEEVYLAREAAQAVGDDPRLSESSPRRARYRARQSARKKIEDL